MISWKKVKKLLEDETFKIKLHLQNETVKRKQTKEKGLLLSYCFECVDKATGFRKFFGFSSSVFENNATLEKFVKQLNSLLNDFASENTSTDPKQLIKQKNFRHTKID